MRCVPFNCTPIEYSACTCSLIPYICICSQAYWMWDVMHCLVIADACNTASYDLMFAYTYLDVL